MMRRKKIISITNVCDFSAPNIWQSTCNGLKTVVITNFEYISHQLPTFEHWSFGINKENSTIIIDFILNY